MKRLALLSALLLLSSCLLQRVLIAQLDTLIEYRISSTLQLYVKQDRQLEKDVPAYLNAQRVIAPRLKVLVQSIRLDNPDESKRLMTEILDIYRTLEEDFRKMLIKHMLSLDASQRKTFYLKLKEQNEELFEKLKKDRTEEYHDRIEFFIGDLTEAQQKMLRPHEQIFLDNDRQRLVRREGFQADLREILDGQAANKEQLLTERFLRQQRESFTNTKHLEGFLADLIKSLNKEQRELLAESRQEILQTIYQFSRTTYE